jgi:drug/metabolite transporter (DMT)-like permease
MSGEVGPEEVSRARVIAAFAVVYVIWGSTYAAISVAIETMPPMLMAGVRFLIAGGLVSAWMAWRGAPRPTRAQWRAAVVVGALLLAGGNGGVVWAEQFVPTGVAALLVATVAFWMVLLEWLRPGGAAPSRLVVAGLLLGFGGLAVLLSPGEFGGGRVHLIGAGVLLLAALCWAGGSIYSRSAVMPSSPLQATGMQMLAGGVVLLLVGLATGEFAELRIDTYSVRSLLAFGYLIVFGSLVGFTAYIWLLRVSTPAKVATYAYVNPVVAVLLGWSLLGEAVTGRMGVAMVVILGAVALITVERTPGRAPVRAGEEPLSVGGAPTPGGTSRNGATRGPTGMAEGGSSEEALRDPPAPPRPAAAGGAARPDRAGSAAQAGHRFHLARAFAEDPPAPDAR